MMAQLDGRGAYSRRRHLREDADMAVIYYTLTGIILYGLADWILKSLEARAGRTFEHRSLVFFGLLLSLALAAFAVIRRIVGA